jgi:hypothetical protein
VESAGVIDLDGVPAEPVVFRAPRRRVLWRLLYAAVFGVCAVVGWLLLHVVWLSGVAAVACLVQVGGAVRSAAGLVTVGAEGVWVRFLVVKRTLPWAVITGCDVREGIFGRGVRLIRVVPHRQLRLPAPASPHLMPDPGFDADVRVLRELFKAQRAANAPAVTASGTTTPRRYRIGLAVLLCAVLLLDQPWGWPSGREAVAVPDPCAAAGDHLTAMVGGYTAEHGSSRTDAMISEWCLWRFPGTRPPQYVKVQFDRYERLGLHSGTWRADAGFTTERWRLGGSAGGSPPGLGDESVLVESDWAAGVISRRGNVVAWVEVRGAVGGYDPVDLLAVDRTMLDGIRFG